MLNNKLGLKNISEIIKEEYKQFNAKYHDFNENKSLFNEINIFNAKYLEKIHIYLFNDLYELDKCQIRKVVPESDIEFVNEKLKEIKELLEIQNKCIEKKENLYNEIKIIKEKYIETKEFLDKDIELVNEKLKKIEEVKKEQELLEWQNNKIIQRNVYDIWERQLFYDGNTRTILCFLKIISKRYKLNIGYNFTNDITKDNFIRELVDSIGIEENVKSR